MTYKDYLRLKEEKQVLEYLGDINEELKEENKKLKDREIELRALITELRIKIGEYENSVSDLEDELDVKTCENKNLKSDLEKFSEAYKRYRDYEKEELADSCYDLERENQKLKEDIIHSLKREESIRIDYEEALLRIKELEKCNLNLQEQIDKITTDRDERKRKEECSNVIIERAKEKGRENGWTI